MTNLKRAIQWLDFIWGDDEGYAHLAHKAVPEETSKFTTISFEWPAERPRVWAWLREHLTTDAVYYVPALNRGRDLRAKTAVSYRWFWAESDRPTPAVLTEWPCWRTTSGRPGHHHVMQELDRAITWEEWDASQAALKAFLGTEQKQNATRFLRVPDSFNFKQEVIGRYGAPRRVKLVHPAGDVMPVERLRAVVREHRTVDTRRPVKVAHRGAQGAERAIPGAVRHRLNDDQYTRSHQGIWQVTRDLVRAGWTNADQIVEVIDGSELHMTKLGSDPAYQLDRDVAGMLAKFGVS